MNNEQLTLKVLELEKELATYRKFFKPTPTQLVITNSVLIKGKLNADRVYTGRSGTFEELEPLP
jgi:hypothetical protein